MIISFLETWDCGIGLVWFKFKLRVNLTKMNKRNSRSIRQKCTKNIEISFTSQELEMLKKTTECMKHQQYF